MRYAAMDRLLDFARQFNFHFDPESNTLKFNIDEEGQATEEKTPLRHALSVDLNAIE